MQIDPQGVWTDIQAIRKLSPLIHNITNYVVMESTANGLLAIGASPVMAHAIDEVEDMVKIAESLVLNIGTLSPPWVQAMLFALNAAHSKKIPIVLDPVGAGATPYRTETALCLLQHQKVSALRANASEIASLVGNKGASKGVDSLLRTTECKDLATALAWQHSCVVWMSGDTDLITDGKWRILIHNGHSLMSKVTGMGCMATALTGAFLAVNPNPLMGCAHAAVVMGIAGEIAAKKCKGPGSFKTEFIDALYLLSLDTLEELIRFKVL